MNKRLDSPEARSWGELVVEETEEISWKEGTMRTRECTMARVK
jgi:hypothetical protein